MGPQWKTIFHTRERSIELHQTQITLTGMFLKEMKAVYKYLWQHPVCIIS